MLAPWKPATELLVRFAMSIVIVEGGIESSKP